jgi:uncharacterized cupredoxin-like copper-binding protein
MILTATLALAAAACGGGGTAATTPTPEATPQTVTFTESEFKIDSSSTTLPPGRYIFKVMNGGKFSHDLHVVTSDGSEVAASAVLAPGQLETVQVNLPKKGTYTFFCAVPGHRARGMEGTLTVQ